MSNISELLIKAKNTILVSFAIPYLGLIGDLIFPADELFARSGALMVACSLYLVYLNHFVKNDLDQSNRLQEALARLPPNTIEVLSGNRDSLNEEMRELLDSKKLESLLAEREIHSTELSAMDSIKIFIVKSEFVLAITGTLIWGLGDYDLLRTITMAILVFLITPYAITIFLKLRKLNNST